METAYTYDGSLGGLLCCVFDSYTRREMPLAILTGVRSDGSRVRFRNG